jgi:predicted nucleotidyltransferase
MIVNVKEAETVAASNRAIGNRAVVRILKAALEHVFMLGMDKLDRLRARAFVYILLVKKIERWHPVLTSRQKIVHFMDSLRNIDHSGILNTKEGGQTMYHIDQLNTILGRLLDDLRAVLGTQIREAILFGSYARQEAGEDSDIDVLVLVDLDREQIAKYTWKIGEIASSLLLDYGVMVSPIVENADYYVRNTDILPFYRNIQREGVKIGA